MGWGVREWTGTVCCARPATGASSKLAGYAGCRERSSARPRRAARLESHETRTCAGKLELGRPSHRRRRTGRRGREMRQQQQRRGRSTIFGGCDPRPIVAPIQHSQPQSGSALPRVVQPGPPRRARRPHGRLRIRSCPPRARHLSPRCMERPPRRRSHRTRSTRTWTRCAAYAPVWRGFSKRARPWMGERAVPTIRGNILTGRQRRRGLTMHVVTDLALPLQLRPGLLHPRRMLPGSTLGVGETEGRRTRAPARCLPESLGGVEAPPRHRPRRRRRPAGSARH